MNITENYFNETFKNTIVDSKIEKAIIGLGVLCKIISKKQKDNKVQTTVMNKVLQFYNKTHFYNYYTEIIKKMNEYEIYWEEELKSYVADGLIVEELNDVPDERVRFCFVLGLSKHRDYSIYKKEQKNNLKNNL